MEFDIDVSEFLTLAVTYATAAGRVGALAASAVRKTALDIEADAKGFAPVDTGNLRNSISTSFEGDGRFSSFTAEIGPTASYGIFQEVGTSRMTGQPFMRPAFDRRVPRFLGALELIAGQAMA